MNAIEVLIDGETIGVYVPPEGSSISAMLANIPRTYARIQLFTSNDSEDWRWQLPDIKPGQTIAFRFVAASPGSGVPPNSIKPRDPREVAENKKLAGEAYARARKKMAAEKRRSAKGKSARRASKS